MGVAAVELAAAAPAPTADTIGDTEAEGEAEGNTSKGTTVVAGADDTGC